MSRIKQIAEECRQSIMPIAGGNEEIEAAIREAAQPLVEALQAMLWHGGVKPENEDGMRCHFPPPCEVCDAKAALADWEAR